jgi:hypothetical protein
MPAAGLEVEGSGVRINERLDRGKRRLDGACWSRLG